MVVMGEAPLLHGVQLPSLCQVQVIKVCVCVCVFRECVHTFVIASVVLQAADSEMTSLLKKSVEMILGK